jgi:hypothetical protein
VVDAAASQLGIRAAADQNAGSNWIWSGAAGAVQITLDPGTAVHPLRIGACRLKVDSANIRAIWRQFPDQQPAALHRRPTGDRRQCRP